MGKFGQALASVFDAELGTGNFKPQALYYDCMDYVEYLCSEKVTVSERIDKSLTLLWNASGEELIGFRIKGFKCLFNNSLKPLFKLNDNDFLPLISVIQAVVENIGNDIVANDARENAYRKVYRLAQEKNATLYDVPFEDAA